MIRRLVYLLIVLFVLLGLLVIWSHRWMQAQRGRAIQSRLDLQDVQRDAAIIHRCKSRPAMALDSERLASETTRLIEQAAKQAGIEPANLSRIVPSAAIRIGDSSYKEKPTEVLFQKVSLREVVSFAHHLAGPDIGLTTTSIRLSAPRNDNDENVWTADMVLTYLIYDPPHVGDQEEVLIDGNPASLGQSNPAIVSIDLIRLPNWPENPDGFADGRQGSPARYRGGTEP